MRSTWADHSGRTSTPRAPRSSGWCLTSTSTRSSPSATPPVKEPRSRCCLIASGRSPSSSRRASNTSSSPAARTSTTHSSRSSASQTWSSWDDHSLRHLRRPGQRGEGHRRPARLVRNFERAVVRGLGLDRHPELKEMLFGNYEALLYLRQVPDARLADKAAEIATYLGLPLEINDVGLGELEERLAELVDARTDLVQV